MKDENNLLAKSDFGSPPDIKTGGQWTGCCKQQKDVPNGDQKDRDNYITATMGKLLLYIVYITIVCIITFGSTTAGAYFLTKVIYDLFIDAPFEGYGGATTTFRKSSTINDFWAFSETAMLKGLYREELHWHHDPFITEQSPSAGEGLMFDNRIVGRARLRQIRMIQDGCPAAKLVPPLARTCYPEYMPRFEEIKPFHRLLGEYEGWMYQTAQELNGSTYWGSLETYSGAGSTLLLNTNSKDTKEQLFPLKNNLWITRATRVVFLDFTFFNPNIDVFCKVKLAWEIPATGGVTTSWDIQIIQLVRYTTPHQKFVLFCQILFILFTGFYIVKEVLHIIQKGFKNYFGEMWSLISITILVISVFCIGFGFVRYFKTNRAVESIVVDADKFVDFQYLGTWENIYNDAAACCIFLIWIKLFKYLSFNRSMSQLSGTLSRSAREIRGFGILFLVVFLAFAQLGHAVFGTQVIGFSTFGRTVFTLLRFILGDFNYREVENANRFLGPIFYLAYVLFVFMILVNMFLAIINDSYQQVKHEIETKGNKIELSETLACCKKRLKDYKIVAASTVNDIFIDPSEIKQNLRSKNFSDMEIEMFLARFDVDEHDNLDADEAHKLLSDVTKNNYRAKDAPGRKRNSVTLKNDTSISTMTAEQKAEAKKLLGAEVEELISRVGVIETAVVELMPRINNILASVDEYHETKIKSLPDKNHPKESYEDFLN